MKIYALVIFLALTAGCSSDPPSNDQPSNIANQSVQAPAEIKPAALGPADTLKALNQASNKKDVAAILRYVSKGTLALLEKGAKEQNKTVDEALKEEGGGPFLTLPELGAEEIDGDKATLEVRNVDTGEFELLPFVKENGEWKVAIDTYLINRDTDVEEEQP